MPSWLEEFRYALRQARRKPGLTLTIVCTLALGIGLNTLIFRVTDAVLLRPLPFAHADRLVMVHNAPLDFAAMNHPGHTLTDWWQADAAFDQTAAFQSGEVTFSVHGEPARIGVAEVTPGYFPTLGLKPLHGRLLTADDLHAQRPVAVIGERLWRQRWHGDPGILGRAIDLNRRSYTVIGIVPDEFTLPRGVSVWITACSANADLYTGMRSFRQNMLAQLRPGLTLAAAQHETNLLAARLYKESPLFRVQLAMGTMDIPKSWAGSFGIHLIPLHTALMGDFHRMLTLLLLATGLVLLIACANIANLMLARGAEREGERVIRVALGATRRRLMTGVFAESTVFGLLGGALGVWLAALAAPILTRLVPDNFSVPLQAQGNDWLHVIAFAVLLSLLAALLFGVGPALACSRVDLLPRLHHAATLASTRMRRRLPFVLVAAEVALALSLLVSAGLLLRSLRAIFAVSSGMNTRNVLVAKLPFSPFQPKTQRRHEEEAILERLQRLPGMQMVSLGSYAPFSEGSVDISPYVAVGPSSGTISVTRPVAALPLIVSDGYLHALQIRLRRGRFLEERDQAGSPPVAVVSESLAQKLWPGRDPIGRQLAQPAMGGGDPNPVHWTVIGVAANARMLGLRAPALPSVYLSFRQQDAKTMWLVLRSQQPSATLETEVRKAVLAVAPDQPLTDLATMEQRLNESVAPVRFPGLLLGAFAALAVLLACLGIYGVLSHFAARQSHEIGIRMVLGARRREVVLQILRQGTAPVLAGILLGLASAMALGRALASLLYQVRPYDVTTLALSVAVLIPVAVLAVLLPARRASRTNPADILRQE